MSDNQAGDVAPAVPSSDQATPARAAKRRGRPAGNTASKKPETPQQRIDRLKTELRIAEQAKREIEARRDAIVGKAVVAHALANADYRKQLAGLLRKEVTGKGDLAIIGELLA
jgi:hypothetical protein